MITFSKHKLGVLTKVFKQIKMKGGLNPGLFVTTEENKNVILSLPNDLLKLDSLRDRTDEILTYMTGIVKAKHVSFVSEVGMSKIDSTLLNDDEIQQLKDKEVGQELHRKIQGMKQDGLIINCFSKEKGTIEKDFMVFVRHGETYLPEKELTNASKDGESPAMDGRFLDILAL